MAWYNFKKTKLSPQGQGLPTPPKNTIPRMPQALTRLRQDAQTRKMAIEMAERAYFPFRYQLQRLYLNTAENLYIQACISKRNDLTLLRKWDFKGKNGEGNQQVFDYFFNTIVTGNGEKKYVKKQWFENFITFTLAAKYYGYSLIKLGDIVNNEFVNTSVHPRGNISPDRLIASSYESLTTGVEFLTDPQYVDNYVWVDTPQENGVSKCGYGMFFWLSVAEIILRNITIFNADYVEVNVAPFRVAKSMKKDEERQQLFEAIINMGSSGAAVIDSMDEIELINNGQGTGYNAYDNFEKRIEKKIAQFILGHADAMESVPGKLGNDSADSPAQMALRDKQTTDGEFVMNIVNNYLIPKMQNRGFIIPEGTTAFMLNDNEDMDNANNVTDLAVKMAQAGLQMDAKYFTEQTKIPVQEMPQVLPPNNNESVKKLKNKLTEIYG